MNASMMSTKRKVHDFDVPLQDEFETIHDSKRLMLDNPRVGLPISGTRQRQESGCSVSSTSSWSSSASFSTVCSSATVPDLLPSPPSRSVASSRSPSPSESATDGDEYNPLWHICEAIALAEKQNGPLAQVKKTAAAANAKSGSYSTITPFTPRTKRERDDSMCGLKIVFLEPNWLAEHMAKSKSQRSKHGLKTYIFYIQIDMEGAVNTTKILWSSKIDPTLCVFILPE
ncbi:hypothetical protein BGZ54_008098 [Gamsiella multidivaricata]|nr:hypothetical protein BGZ54_008098 [Gamsiella multidivaricata]